MELEFDKEMDSLLRKTGETQRGVLVGDKPDEKPKVHLDADGLSAFAENAMPEKSRALYMAHLADCGHCRRILSGLIMLNADAGPAEGHVVAPAILPAANEPWYRRLLLPNLAYVMGGLVLVFGGLIAFTVFQSSERGEVSMSQPVANVAPGARGPMFEDAQAETEQATPSLESMNANSNAAVAASNSMAVANKSIASANSAANFAASSPREAPADARKEPDADSANEKNKISRDGMDAAKPAMAAPAAPVTAPPDPSKTEMADSSTVASGEAKDDGKSKSVASKKVQDLESDRRDVQQERARTQAGGLLKSTPGPSREAQQNFPNRANNTSELYEEKRISGKGFQRRNNVWYDNSYRGQATTNVRRGTDDYRKLDSGLRSIAESFSGVVVVMWTGKAYRIQ